MPPATHRARTTAAPQAGKRARANGTLSYSVCGSNRANPRQPYRQPGAPSTVVQRTVAPWLRTVGRAGRGLNKMAGSGVSSLIKRHLARRLMMRRRSLLLLLPILAVVGVQAAGPETKYRAPRAVSNQPDLGGVWNFSSDVPLERPAAAAEKKILSPEERDKHRASIENVFKMIGTFAPVEDVQISWL